MDVTYAFSFHFLFPHLSSTGIERVAKHTVYMGLSPFSQKRLKKYEAIHFICTTLEEKHTFNHTKFYPYHLPPFQPLSWIHLCRGSAG